MLITIHDQHNNNDNVFLHKLHQEMKPEKDTETLREFK